MLFVEREHDTARDIAVAVRGEAPLRQEPVQCLLCLLYTSFHYVSYAAYLCAREPERLQLVTKWLYSDVALQYNTN